MTSNATNGRVQWRDGALCTLLVFLPLCFSLQFRSFEHPKELLLLTALLPFAATVPLAAFAAGARALLPLWLGLATAVVTGMFQARVPAYLVEEAGRIALLLLFTGIVWDVATRPGAYQRIATALGAGAVGVAVVGLAQYAGLTRAWLPAFAGYTQPVYSVFGNQDLFGGYLALGFTLVLGAPAVPRTPWRQAMAIIALLLLAGALVLSGSRSAWLAAAAGVLFSLSPAAPRGLRLRRLGVVLVLGVLPFAMLASPRPLERIMATFSPSDVGGSARLWFWDGTLRMLADAPWVGLGLGQFPYHSPRYLGEALAAPGGARHYHNELHTEHAHNELLEYLAETGLLGGIFAAWMLWRLLHRGPHPARAPLAALFTFACFNAAAHSTPFAVAGLLLLASMWPPCSTAGEESVRHAARAPLVALCVAVVALRLYTVLVPSVLLTRAEDEHLAGTASEPAYRRALAWPWPNARAHESYAIALIEAGRLDAARDQLIAAQDGLDTGRVHLLLGELALANGERSSGALALERCLFRWPASRRAWQGLWDALPLCHPALARHAARWLPDQD